MSKKQVVEVRIVPNAKRNEVKEEENKFKVYLTAPPVGGKANKLLAEILAEYFKVKKSHINILKGEKSRNKIIQID